jgi:hypothetical protein
MSLQKRSRRQKLLIWLRSGYAGLFGLPKLGVHKAPGESPTCSRTHHIRSRVSGGASGFRRDFLKISFAYREWVSTRQGVLSSHAKPAVLRNIQSVQEVPFAQKPPRLMPFWSLWQEHPFWRRNVTSTVGSGILRVRLVCCRMPSGMPVNATDQGIFSFLYNSSREFRDRLAHGRPSLRFNGPFSA